MDLLYPFAFIYFKLMQFWGWWRPTKKEPLILTELKPVIRKLPVQQVCTELYPEYYENPLRRSWDGREKLFLD